MAFAQQVGIASAKPDVRGGGTRIILGCSILALVMLLAIYLAAAGPGTASADFANMVAFP